MLKHKLTLSYELDTPLTKGSNKTVMGLVISDSLIHANYLMKLFCCCEKVFTHMTT